MTVAKDAEIGERLHRIEEIVEELESGDPSLSEGEALLEEGRRRVQGVRELLDRGRGEVIEIGE